MDNIQKENIFIEWFAWHFWEMPKFLVSVWKNYINFALNFFSAPLLLKTFFSPWRRSVWKYPKVFDIKEIFSTFVSNTFSRVVGAICRFVLLITGAIFQVSVLLIGFIAILFWLLIPFIILWLLILI
jgi:hypothetical protein